MATDELNFSHLKRRGLLTPCEERDLKRLNVEANSRAQRTLGGLRSEDAEAQKTQAPA